MRLQLLLWVAGLISLSGSVRACELCAIYNATSASGQSSSGWLLSLSEQFVPYRTLQFNGDEFSMSDPDYLVSSITHIVPTYNFSPRFGLSLNLPVVYRSFKQTELRYSTSAPSQLRTNEATELGIGDVALVARWTAWEESEMEYGIILNLLGGVKFPTGDTDRVEDEVEQARIYNSTLPPNTPHDPLGHSISGVQQHEISPGSGSFDGIFGVTLNTRWQRFFFNSQALAVYDTLARAELLGRKSDSTGMTAWYMGPLATVTWGERFSANAGGDIPLRIVNNGFQNVPNFRFQPT